MLHPHYCQGKIPKDAPGIIDGDDVGRVGLELRPRPNTKYDFWLAHEREDLIGGIGGELIEGEAWVDPHKILGKTNVVVWLLARLGENRSVVPPFLKHRLPGRPVGVQPD